MPKDKAVYFGKDFCLKIITEESLLTSTKQERILQNLFPCDLSSS